MNAVGIDVSKGRSTVAILRPMGEVVMTPEDVCHDASGLEGLADRILSLEDDTKVLMEATGRYSEGVSAAAFTPGTEEYAAAREWLDRLCDLPRAIERFHRHAHGFLDEFLPDDITRKPGAYAEAYQRYRMREQLTAFTLEDEVYERNSSDFVRARSATRDEQSCRSFPSSFPISVAYRTVANPKNRRELMMVEEVGFRDWDAFVSRDLFRGLAAGHIPRRCQNCGRYFLLDSGHDIRYCGNIAPDGKGKTCRQIGAHRKERAGTGVAGQGGGGRAYAQRGQGVVG